MKIENQVCALKYSKHLKELGVKQESIWWWELHNNSESELRYVKNGKIIDAGDNYYYSAYTVAELGEMLPLNTCSVKSKPLLSGIIYGCGFDQGRYKNRKVPIHFATIEANAKAKLLIFLKENKLL